MRTALRTWRWSVPVCLAGATGVLLSIAVAAGTPFEIVLPAVLLLAAFIALTHAFYVHELAADGVPSADSPHAEVGSRTVRALNEAEHFIAREFAAAQRGRDVTLVMFGFSRFDEFIEREGASAATEAVREFGMVLSRMTRQMNLSARYGWRADSFLSVLSGGNADAARAFIARVRDAATASTVPLPGIDAGIAVYQPHIATPDEFVEAAERSLAAARAAAFNRPAAPAAPRRYGGAGRRTSAG